MDLEKLSNFIIPIVMIILYFILNAKVKKKEPEAHSEQQRDLPPRKKPALPKREPLPVYQKVVHSPVLSAAVPLKRKVNKPSYAKKLLKGRSLRQAFLMKEILNRPYE